ncbi:MAG: hypothetical protein VX527_07940 [Planctomycetota bacterium]|nr:hypothetical protein [Planctomycetota bacterium]
MTMAQETPPTDSTAKRWPGGGCLLLAALVVIGGSVVGYGFWQIWSTVSEFEDRYLESGYVLEEGTSLTITEPIMVNTYLYARETLRVEAGAQASLAITAHEAFITGTVTGDVAFLGGDLEISDGAIIEGVLDVSMARNVVLRGEILGGVTGTWTRLYELKQGPAEEGEATDHTPPDGVD